MFYNDFFNNKIINNQSVKYHLSFVTTISPYSLINFRSFLGTKILREKKVYVKQSYMILTWFYYISSFHIEKKKNFSFLFLPYRKKTFTLLKAPMAHKTSSKEQFKFKFFKLSFFFHSFLTFTNNMDVNTALLFVLISKNFFPFFETNLLFLKSYSFFIYFKDPSYFSYYKLK